MIAEGLLWYDDDPRRPFNAKMAEAARRFSERTGWAPTACEVNPQTLAQRDAVVAAARGGRAKAALAAEEAQAPRLAVTPNPSLRPNYILVGIEVGKTPRPARKERAAKAAAKAAAAPAKGAAKEATPAAPAPAAPASKRAPAARAAAPHASATSQAARASA
jgi:hypothetical protein